MKRKRKKNRKKAIKRCPSCDNTCGNNISECPHCLYSFYRPHTNDVEFPTPEQIEQITAEIRECWSLDEYFRRSGISMEQQLKGYTIPTVRIGT